jgi:hypothetical protein
VRASRTLPAWIASGPAFAPDPDMPNRDKHDERDLRVRQQSRRKKRDADRPMEVEVDLADHYFDALRYTEGPDS